MYRDFLTIFILNFLETVEAACQSQKNVLANKAGEDMGVLLCLYLGKKDQMSLVPICRYDISLAKNKNHLHDFQIFGIFCILTLLTKFVTPKVLP